MRTLYFCPWFLLSSSSFFPSLISAVADWCGHGVALVRISDAGLKRAARGSLEIQDAKKSPKIAIWAPSHNFVEGMCRQSEKNLLSSNISSTCPHNMANVGPLTAEIGSVVWGTPANFNGFCILVALLHCTLVVGVSQTLRH